MGIYEGRGVDLTLDGDVLVLTKKALFGKDVTRRIPIQALTEVRLKEAGRLAPGSLQLVIAGEPARKADFNDPNTVMFLPKFNAEFSALHEHLAAVIQRNREQGVDPAAAEYDQGVPGRLVRMTEGLGDNIAEMGERAAAQRAERNARDLAEAGITRPDVTEAVMAMNGFFGMATEVPKLEALLGPDETLRRLAGCSRDSSPAILALTDVRLLFIDRQRWGHVQDELPLRVITSVSTDTGFLESDLVIHTVSGHTISLAHVDDVETFAAILRTEVNRATAPAPAPAASPPGPDVLDQLAKLGQLRDAGVLTAEEFEAKKAQLLDRL